MVQNLPANAGDTRDVGSIHGSGRFPGGGHGRTVVSLPRKGQARIDRGAWQATAHRVAKSQTLIEVT